MKKKLVSFSVVAVAMLSLIFLAGCGKMKKERVHPEKKVPIAKKVGISFAVTSNPFDQAEKASLLKAAKDNGFKVIVKDAKNKLSSQHGDIESLIASKVGYLVVVPMKEKGFKGAFFAALEAKLPIILINRGIKGVPGKDFKVCITPDGVWEGKAAAEWLLNNIDGKISVVQLIGTPGASVTNERTEGFRDAVHGDSRIKILESKVCDFSFQEAYDKTKKLIKVYIQTGLKVNAIFAQNDSMALGAIKALKEEGIQPGKDIFIVGVDGQKEAKEAIEKGEMAATVGSSPDYGPIVFKNILAIEAGKDVEPIQEIRGKVYDKSNISQLDAF